MPHYYEAIWGWTGLLAGSVEGVVGALALLDIQ
jgi:hypothetical protein